MKIEDQLLNLSFISTLGCQVYGKSDSWTPLNRLDNELVELVWQNGEIVLQSQTNRTQSHRPKSKQLHQSTTGATENPNNLIQDDETNSWLDCPIDESFGKEFCANFLSEMPPFSPDEPIKPSKKPERVFKFGASVVNHVAPSPQQQDFTPPPPPPPPPLPPPPRFQTSDAAQLAINKHGECSIMTVGSSHCASNQTGHEVDMSWASSSGIGSRTMSETYDPKVNERETREQAMTSCSRGSGSSFWKTSSQSNDTSKHKRKSMDVEESECPSDATEFESAAGNKTSQKSGATRRSRVAEVHNLSERRRRDRINEKMRALQELIPHSNKSDKASMLDEAIEYMKALQLQIQLMWMGRGMAPMMLPSMQHYMSHAGMGIRNPMLPAIVRLPLMDQAMSVAQTPDLGHSAVNYPNQMQNSSFPDQYANYMGFHSMPNASQQTNMFDFGFHSAQQKPQSNGNGYENRQ